MTMRIKTALLGLTALALLVQPAMAPTEAPKAVAATHERLIPLVGGRNFRDLGGYRAADGRTVKWGLLFRSGAMSGLTANDYATLSKIGIQVVCDFRSKQERMAEPTKWAGEKTPTFYSEDYDMATSGLMPAVDYSKLTGESARAMLAGSYPKMLTSFAPQYRRMFGELLAGHAPLAFHCAGGKDRTGVAAALILTALGVPRETVIEDYLLTNRYLNASKLMAKGSAAAVGPWSTLPPEVLKAMGAADRSYIEAALTALDAHPGGATGYFHDEMKLSDADIVTLRKMYLE